MRRISIIASLLVSMTAPGFALTVTDLNSTIAMPLAVAEVSEVQGVEQNDLSNLVVSLNRAEIPATQFVEIIRYSPVVFLDAGGRPFVQYVEERRTQGVTGASLVDALVQRLRSDYYLSPSLGLSAPATTLVVQRDYIPEVVTTRIATPIDALALIAMPLAVAAVSDVTGVPSYELANLVATLNQAYLPPVQFVETLRYAPVALISTEGTPFVQYVQHEVSTGVWGNSLYPVVVRRLQTYYPAEVRLSPTPPPRVTVRRDFIPTLVTTRVAEVRTHPHGGPPGQLKKERGLQTGAEIVHGSSPRETSVKRVAPQPAPHIAKERKPRVEPNRVHKEAKRTGGQGAQNHAAAPPAKKMKAGNAAVPHQSGGEKSHGNAGKSKGGAKSGGKGHGKG